MSELLLEEIDVMVEGSRLTGVIARPATPAPAVILLHSWWGLTPFFKNLCRSLAGEGFSVFAPDLNVGQTARTIPEAEKLMKERDSHRTEAIALASVSWMREQQAARVGKPAQSVRLGLIGFSMGAAWATELSSLAADAVAAVVLFYGDGAVDFSTVSARFQGHFGEKDEWTTQAEAALMEKNMRLAGLQVDFHRYPDTDHWFIESDRPETYAEPAATLAWTRTLAFLKSELAPEQP